MESIDNFKYVILNEWTDNPPAGCVTLYYDTWFESLSEVKPIVDEIIDYVKNAIRYEEEKGKGKTCIIIALISVVISLVVLFVNISSQSSGY